jgi:Haem-degrading/Competence-damaged protein
LWRATGPRLTDTRALEVPADLLAEKGAVCPPIAKAMARGALAHSPADIAVDPMLGKQLGGVIVFGGGLALYSNNDIVGGLGVSGDTSCADHNIAWRLRHALGLDHVPAGVSPEHNDGIIYDMLPDKTSASGYGHANCKGTEAQVAEQIHAGFVPGWARPTQ